MLNRVRQAVLLMVGCLMFAGLAQAQTHIVSPADLQNETAAATQTRQNNIDTINHFLSTPQAQQAMKDANIDPSQIRTAVPTLSDSELANISSRATKAQNDFAAGTLSDRDLILIIVAILVLVLLIVALR